jgi:hypothetical protein
MPKKYGGAHPNRLRSLIQSTFRFRNLIEGHLHLHLHFLGSWVCAIYTPCTISRILRHFHAPYDCV